VPQDANALLDRICEMVAARIDPRRVADARRRQADMFAWRESDYIPITFGREVEEAKDLPSFDWREQFYDPAKSLYMQMKGVLSSAVSEADNVPGVRADTGVVNCMSIFGAGFDVPAHTKPVVNRPVPKERLAEFEVPEDISALGVMPRMVEHMEHHLAVLRRWGLAELVSVHHCDQQGPFDIAAGARGHEIFVDLYEDPDFVHALMDKCVDVYVKVSRLCKRINGEPLDGGNASGVWLTNGGVRMCGDSDILIGAEMHRQFVAPYEQKALAPFGGGWMHYCGGARGYRRPEGLHLHEVYAGIEGLRGLNWTTAGDWLAELRRLRGLGLVHFGTCDRETGEALEDWFRRVLGAYDRRRGLVFQALGFADGEADRAAEAWRRAQDERFG